MRSSIALLLVLSLFTLRESSAQLSSEELRILEIVDEQFPDGIDFLERIVNVNSGTGNHDGVRAVGAMFAEQFRDLGFQTSWDDLPDSIVSAGHLFAERRGDQGRRLLLIGHLDTVFEADSPFQTFEMMGDTAARGPGVSDMKGGDVVVLQALRALHTAGVLHNTSIIVAFTGDEEQPGRPLSVNRASLIEAAQRSDAALAFEGGLAGIGELTIARRGFTGWTLRVTGRRGHSSLIFGEQYGDGAIYPVAAIITAFRQEMGGEEYLTFNVGSIVGGTDVTFDTHTSEGRAFGKTNVIAQTAIAAGDLRTLSIDQLNRAKQRMRSIVAREYPGAEATIEFDDSYPPMFPSDGNRGLLAVADQISRDMGDGPVTPFDPGRRGAADVSFVAPYIDGIDGLGPVGFEEHSTDEWVELTSLPTVIKRAALLIYRLTR
ncbi:MAG: M20/M25/M40 family metallo-hydrolase [Gemmatimonadales bacterium]